MALNRSDKSRILRRYFPGMTRNSEMSTEPRKRSGAIGFSDIGVRGPSDAPPIRHYPDCTPCKLACY